MKLVGTRYWFTIGNGSQAHRGEVKRQTDYLITLKVYQENGKSVLKTYLIEKVNLIEVW